MTESNDYIGELEGGDMLERVASRVHDAWWDEKKAQGFHPPLACRYANPRPAIGSEEAEEAAFTKHCEWCHTDMYPYSTLPEHVKEYDRATVRAVFSAMSGEGWLPPEEVGELRRSLETARSALRSSSCPRPVSTDDGSVGDCCAKGHCGCDNWFGLGNSLPQD